MTKEELEHLFMNDDSYRKNITECENWVNNFKRDVPDKDKSNRASKYILKNIDALKSFEQLLTGKYSKDVAKEFGPKKGDDFNLATIPFFQTQLLSIHYRISLITREVQKVNKSLDLSDAQEPLHEVLDAIIENKQGEIFVRGYIPQYVHDLDMKTFYE